MYHTKSTLLQNRTVPLDRFKGLLLRGNYNFYQILVDFALRPLLETLGAVLLPVKDSLAHIVDIIPSHSIPFHPNAGAEAEAEAGAESKPMQTLPCPCPSAPLPLKRRRSREKKGTFWILDYEVGVYVLYMYIYWSGKDRNTIWRFFSYWLDRRLLACLLA